MHADYDYSGHKRRVPQFLARGPFNEWGYDLGITSEMTQNDDGLWELEIMATWPTYVQLNVFGFDNYYYGDTDGDGIMDRLPPILLRQTTSICQLPQSLILPGPFS